MVGDMASDILCAHNAGVKSVLINYNNSENSINVLLKEGKSPNFVASDFQAACEFIINDSAGEDS
jgi:phosphoglycolate phosphatase-like HAD superfamily hydrolase